MAYARWCKEKEMKSVLNAVNIGEGVKESGVPIINDGKMMYFSNGNAHSLVVGSIGSGKTQTTILPMIKSSMLAGESIVINDVKGELYQSTAFNFKSKGYDVLVLDFDNPNLGNSWNPCTLPYELYKKGEIGKASKLLDDLGYYLFTEPNDRGDSFWTNSVIDYFTGLSLYLFENAKENEINLNSIYNLGNELDSDVVIDKFLSKLNKTSNIYYNLSGTLKSPAETRGGIIATFNQKMKKYVGLDDLSSMLGNTNFDIKEVGNKKTAIFMVSGLNTQSNYLIPLFVSQLITVIDEFGDKKRLFNIILDEFDSMLPIKNFARLINYSRSIYVKFVVVISSYISLSNVYGKEDVEIIKACFPIIIYLLSNDLCTLEEISKWCGNREVNDKIEPLISIEELKVMKVFEAIVLMSRMMPFKTKLCPDYKIEWNLEDKGMDIPSREVVEKSIYKLDI